jgi:MoaD family protein
VRVKVQSFAEIREALGKDVIELDVIDNATLYDVFAKMAETYGNPFKSHIWNKVTGKVDPFLVVINGKIRNCPNEFGLKVKDGDEISILLPLMGG